MKMNSTNAVAHVKKIMAQGASIPSTVKWSLVATISTTETGDDGDTCGEPT